MLSEISQAEKVNYHMVSLTWWSIRNNTEDMGRWRGEVSWGKSERGTNQERLWTLRNNLRVLEGRGAGEPGGGYYGGHVLHGALGVMHKQ